MSPKQNGVRRKNTYVKILMDSSASASIIHESYLRKNRGKHPRINGSQWLDLFLLKARLKLR